MLYSFDIWGWLSETDIPGRQTDVAPPDPSEVPEGQKPNFTGYKWILLPYSPPPPPDPLAEAKMLGRQVAEYLDRKVHEDRDYDDMKAACTYALSSVPQYKAEGQACINWRDAVWVKFYEIMGAVQTGTRPMPTFDGLIAELPALEWPPSS